MSEVAGFYDAWAVDYDAAYADWATSVRAQGELLAAALTDRGVGAGARVLDCTCGIGTQAIGLALAGYDVCGSDISAAEVERARAEATTFGVSVEFVAADLLDLVGTLPAGWKGFDAVITANSLTHMADGETLVRALAQMVSACRSNGVVAVTNRDYDSVGRPASTAVQRSTVAGVQRVSFQLWDWSADGRSYRMEDVLLTRPESSTNGEWIVRSRSTTLHAWRRADIELAAAAAGLLDPRWHETAWQPIATFRIP
jgi:2-polyprenyl-3-methyl-5-hydroxy-6-metoxy-1,4-benzoquinol methylase